MHNKRSRLRSNLVPNGLRIREIGGDSSASSERMPGGAWLTRGIFLGIVSAVVRVALGAAVTRSPSHDTLFRLVAIFVIVFAATMWGSLDGRRDVRWTQAHKYSPDWTLTWLKAALGAALVAAVAGWAVGQLAPISVGRNSLLFEITSGAAFTLWLVYIPAAVGLAGGRLLSCRTWKRGQGHQNSGHIGHIGH